MFADLSMRAYLLKEALGKGATPLAPHLSSAGRASRSGPRSFGGLHNAFSTATGKAEDWRGTAGLDRLRIIIAQASHHPDIKTKRQSVRT